MERDLCRKARAPRRTFIRGEVTRKVEDAPVQFANRDGAVRVERILES